jgi:hypothetical protein
LLRPISRIGIEFMAKKKARNRPNGNLRGPVTYESRRPANLRRYGKAGLRVLIDEMLEARDGLHKEEWLALGPSGLVILHALALGSEPSHFRNRAIGAVGLVANASSVSVLGGIARDRRENVIVRVASMLSLAEIGGAAPRRLLEGLLGDDELLVRHRAAEGLGKIADAKALSRLRVARDDKAELVRQAANTAIERIELIGDLRAAGDTRKRRR